MCVLIPNSDFYPAVLLCNSAGCISDVNWMCSIRCLWKVIDMLNKWLLGEPVTGEFVLCLDMFIAVWWSYLITKRFWGLVIESLLDRLVCYCLFLNLYHGLEPWKQSLLEMQSKVVYNRFLWLDPFLDPNNGSFSVSDLSFLLFGIFGNLSWTTSATVAFMNFVFNHFWLSYFVSLIIFIDKSGITSYELVENISVWESWSNDIASSAWMLAKVWNMGKKLQVGLWLSRNNRITKFNKKGFFIVELIWNI